MASNWSLTLRYLFFLVCFTLLAFASCLFFWALVHCPLFQHTTVQAHFTFSRDRTLSWSKTERIVWSCKGLKVSSVFDFSVVFNTIRDCRPKQLDCLLVVASKVIQTAQVLFWISAIISHLHCFCHVTTLSMTLSHARWCKALGFCHAVAGLQGILSVGIQLTLGYSHPTCHWQNPSVLLGRKQELWTEVWESHLYMWMGLWHM